MARHLGPLLSERWKQPVVVENRPQPVIHADIVAKAAPDGYTLLMGQFSSHASPPSLYKKLSYDPVKDFAGITLVSKAPLLLVAHPSVPASNVQEFIAYAKQRPGEILYAAQSGGSNGRLTMELFSRRAGLDMRYVAYRSPAFSLSAVLAREAEVSFLTVMAAQPQVKAGKLKGFAVTSEKRFAGSPDIPTMIESGLPGFESTVWYGVFAPARTPLILVNKLNYDMVEILRRRSFQAALLAQGAEVSPGTPDELMVFVKSEIVKWGKVIREIGIQPQ
jgi:tripartite-type tricarboxylate transporter receptor subunit TctC